MVTVCELPGDSGVREPDKTSLGLMGVVPRGIAPELSSITALDDVL